MEDQRSIIMAAARKRFAYYGLEKTTMNEIAGDIGISKAALYYYFTDKEQLFVAVVEGEIDEFRSVIGALIERPSRASYKLKKYVQLRGELLVRLLNLAKVERVDPVEMFKPIYTRLRDHAMSVELDLIARILSLGVNEKEFCKLEVTDCSEVFLKSLMGLRSSVLLSGSVQPQHGLATVERQTAFFLELFLRAIQKPV